MFIGRDRELKDLEDLYSKQGLRSIAVYGRRRVGKTSLLKKFCENKRTIFFVAREDNETINLKAYGEALSKATGITMGSFGDFEDAMKTTAEICQGKKTVLVIDELPFVAKAAGYFASTLQYYMDHVFDRMDITVIVCGSSIGMMDDLLNGRQRPLFGRFSRQMELKPFDYSDSHKFIPGAGCKRSAETFGITGGVPLYLKLMSEGTFKEALIDNFLKPSSFLREEPLNILRQEFSNPSIYSSILSAMADGKTQISHISDASGVEMSTCSKYISSMELLGLVRKEVPMSNSKKRPVYEIADGLFRFKYSVIDKVRMQILAGEEEEAYESAMKLMPNFMGERFEVMCRQFLFLNTKYRMIGKWWGNDPEMKTEAEIDIVAADGTDSTANVLFGSCKYWSRPMNLQDLEELFRVSALVKGYRNRDYALFSLSGFDEDLTEAAEEQDVRLYTLKDLYGGRRT